MKLQIKVSGSISSLMDTSTKTKVTGKLDVIAFYNGVCNESYYFVNGKYSAVVFKGKGLQSFENNGNVIITGDVSELEFYNEKGQVIKTYYIPDCIIQLIDNDEEPEAELFD